MQGEPEAALQSLESVHSRCTEQMQQSSADETLSSSESDDGAQQPMQQSSTAVGNHSPEGAPNDVSPDPVRGLCVKALLAKASILRQVQKHSEANVCMQEAKKLDPAVGKSVKQ